jgi:hypothetical protein
MNDVVVPFGLFVLSSSVWLTVMQRKQRSNLVKESSHPKKEEIHAIRLLHFCKKVTISYSNSGGLMIVGVSCDP